MRPKIDRREMAEMARQGATATQIAERFDCSVSAVSQQKKKLKTAVNKSVTLNDAQRFLDADLDLLSRSQEIEDRLLDLADRQLQLMEGEEDAVALAESLRHRLVRTVYQDPAQIYVRTMGELSKVLRNKKDLLQSLYDIGQVKQFQSEIIQLLGEVDSNVRRQFIQRLKENRLLARSLGGD